ncbi:ATP-dependent DNA ligase [Gordonia jinhuaensis]|uniref:DNA ligase (ATP) n=1 Tax=Gordonia jinhuaensis TaxID=1517702 RepID=A0A916TIE3_9ACTN|nr:ATP-dependent DNA ligase [Gordonia jinhuaensis]GGB44900.1 putative ATP-dependent DNA ligase [Gordonia jinhuaensis]
MARPTQSIEVDGRRITLSHLDKVLYPVTGTVKAEVIDYYAQIADVMLPHLADRIITRKRWPDGVDATPFFEKNLPSSAPGWIRRCRIRHSDRDVTYPIATARADLVWLAQQAALELHVPQWRVPPDTDSDPFARASDRVVLDLDPGPDVDLAACAKVAIEVRELLDSVALRSFPVTSGSKGIHVYAALHTAVSPEAARAVARQIATSLAALHPDTITATMARDVRAGKVFIDWSQNSGSKTTLSPYSLRGREQPWVAAPRHWEELDDKDIRQLLFHEVLERVAESGDLLADLDAPRSDEVTPTAPRASTPAAPSTPVPELIDLSDYRAKRHRNRTPEPFGDSSGPAEASEDGDSEDAHSEAGRTPGPIFVIQEHHARRLHYDFRLERGGVLVSWAVPKNLPTDTDQNRLAVHTEDHPLDYADFEGTIPHGEYGGGEVTIYDRGTYETEKWRDNEVIVRLHGDKVTGRYALINTGGKNWLAHLMSDEASPIMPESLRDPRPMLATEEPIDGLSGDVWAFEGKWDGYRLIVRYIDGELTFTTRAGIDMTDEFSSLASIADDLGLLDVVLDGEVVAVDSTGRTNFSLLSARHTTDEPFTLRLYLFDVLYLNGTTLLRKPWSDRRAVLEGIAPLFPADSPVSVPALLDGDGAAALDHSRDRGWEGVVAKKRDSTYQQGRRTHTWRKHKNWNDIEVVVGGWRPGKGNRATTIGSLLVGLPEHTGLRYVGRVGTGFTEAQLDELAAELRPLHRTRSPFLDPLDRPIERDAVWVLPKIVGSVRFMDWTTSGHLRHPSWRGIRRDKLPGDL